jgi:hypothetical protein
LTFNYDKMSEIISLSLRLQSVDDNFSTGDP